MIRLQYLMHGKKKILISFILGVIIVSCSEQKQSKLENSKNKELIDSLAIEKIEKSNEIKELNSELDSLKKLRDSLKINPK